MPTSHGWLTPETLRQQVTAGEIDSVIVALTDMQGRLAGKRCSARYFLEEVLGHGAEACNYLLTVDVEQNTVGDAHASAKAFGSDVVAHYLRAAEVELEAFQRAVTGWERFRGFGRL